MMEAKATTNERATTRNHANRRMAKLRGDACRYFFASPILPLSIALTVRSEDNGMLRCSGSNSVGRLKPRQFPR